MCTISDSLQIEQMVTWLLQVLNDLLKILTLFVYELCAMSGTILYNLWVMEGYNIVQAMGHGWVQCCMIHGSWGGTTLYGPWVMEVYNVI